MSLNFWDALTVGTVGGALAGLTVWSVNLVKEMTMTEIHKRRVYNWLYQRTKKGKGLTVGSPINDPRWVSTSEIACFTNLTIERIRYICSIHKKIRPKTEQDAWKNVPLKEEWAIREFVS
jgi:hypothetical protein